MADTQLEKLHSIVDEDDYTPDDELLSLYLTFAADKIRNRAYPYGDGTEEIPTRYLSLQVEIAAYLYGKRGAEGEAQHQENGINRTYHGADVPADMLAHIIPIAGVR